MTPAKGGVGLPEGGAGGRHLVAGGGGAHLGWRPPTPGSVSPAPRGPVGNPTESLFAVRPWTSITRPNLSTGVRWFLHEIIVDLSLLNAFVKN